MKKEVDSIQDWQRFYHDVFGIEVNLSKLKIPDKKEGFDRPIIVSQGMTSQKLLDKCMELFRCRRWSEIYSLDYWLNSERTAETGAYAVWSRDTIEADEDLKNLSANDLKERSIPGITLEERLLFELKYFKETGEHLDVENITLCSGSRFRPNQTFPYVDPYEVPYVRWCWNELRVDRFFTTHRFDSLRSRRAVL